MTSSMNGTFFLPYHLACRIPTRDQTHTPFKVQSLNNWTNKEVPISSFSIQLKASQTSIISDMCYAFVLVYKFI